MLTIGLVLLVAVALLLAFVATRPAGFRVARSATIAAPPEVVFAQLNDFRRWSSWSPFEKLDPAMKKTFEGSPSGVGAAFHYVAPKAGEGRMTLIESEPNERVAIKAQFIKPFAATNEIEFTLRPASDGVAVTWAMTGRNSFVFKLFALFVNPDRLLGKSFEQGLADLKRVAETA
jgi:hypothetical protein